MGTAGRLWLVAQFPAPLQGASTDLVKHLNEEKNRDDHHAHS